MRKKVTKQDASADHLVVFQEKAIRRTLHDDEWWFVITDIVAALTDAADPSDYWKKMRRRDPDLSLDSQGGGQIDPPLAFDFETAGGRQKLQCWNTQGIFRLIQSIPSPKAEPFKRWLAKVGKERLDEIENPELAMGRMQELYEKKGYPKEWIDKRLRGIAVRQDLTDEWKQRGVASRQEFAILTNEIMHGTLPHDRHRADPDHAGRGDHHQAAPRPRFKRYGAAHEGCQRRRRSGRAHAQGY